ncbi:DciA family protein [Streptomyces sp. NPDC046862]|uniref:DciA family protein n=1 Tax=Streptomyces sp. NPDC046862 TaxID=3154603 RepID=UPI0034549093
MTDTPTASGADLARQALAAYKATARNQPTQAPKKPRRSSRPARGEGRDPQGLGHILGRLTAEQGWDNAVAGGSVLDRWTELCPQYAGCVEPAAYDEQRGRLDLRPASHAYASQLRLLGGQLAKQINDKMGRPVVRTIRVLPPGNLTSTPRTAAPTQPEPEASVRTRETASDGYRQTIALALDNRPAPRPTDPYVAEAIARQEAALRAGRQHDDEHQEAVAEQERLERSAGPRPGSVEASISAAIAYKRREAAGLNVPRRAFDVA